MLPFRVRYFACLAVDYLRQGGFISVSVGRLVCLSALKKDVDKLYDICEEIFKHRDKNQILGCAALLRSTRRGRCNVLIAVWKATTGNRNKTKLLTSSRTIRLALAEVCIL